MRTEEVLRLIQDVAERVITPRFRALAAGQVREKNPGDLVTVADHEAEELLTEALLAAHPEAVVLGEEASAVDPSLQLRYAAAEHAFTVDPVDGTKNFVHGSPDHAVMVSELRDGQVVRAWIWQPQHATAYVAERGGGAWRNGRRLHRPAAAPAPDQWRGVTSRRSWLGRALPGLRPLELTWVCCGVDYPRLAEGAADYVLYARNQPWDHAPGSLLLGEAGGVLADRSGAAYDARSPGAGVGSGVGSGLVAAADRRVLDTVLALLPDLDRPPS